MKVLVTGSRNWTDRDLVFKTLDEINPDCIVHGAARGADSYADEWGVSRNVIVRAYPAEWRSYGRAAGSMRNQLMLDDNPDIDLVVAFPLPSSKGTIDMISKAKLAGIKIYRINPR